MGAQDEKRKVMYEIAQEHGDRFLLPRFNTGTGQYETAQWLVNNGYARWIDGGSSFSPGIELTGKPWPPTASPSSPDRQP
jgi:hypothetical protein